MDRPGVVKAKIRLDLVHDDGTKKTVEVIRATHKLPRLIISWPLVGELTLDVSRNRVQRHHYWHAADSKAALALWRELRDAQRGALIAHRTG